MYATAMGGPGSTVLVVVRDRYARAFLGEQLRADGFDVLFASTPATVRRQLSSVDAAAMILDLDLRNGRAEELLCEIRDGSTVPSRIDPGLPIIALNAGSELNTVRALERGADDVVPADVAYSLLLARLRALLRRSSLRVGGVTRLGPLTIDPVSRTTTLDGRLVQLTGREFALLRMLASDPAKVFTKAELLRAVWGYRAVGTTRTLDSHACRLRAKLTTPDGPRWITNIWGTGYRLLEDTAVAPSPAAAAA